MQTDEQAVLISAAAGPAPTGKGDPSGVEKGIGNKTGEKRGAGTSGTAAGIRGIWAADPRRFSAVKTSGVRDDRELETSALWGKGMTAALALKAKRETMMPVRCISSCFCADWNNTGGAGKSVRRMDQERKRKVFI